LTDWETKTNLDSAATVRRAISITGEGMQAPLIDRSVW